MDALIGVVDELLWRSGTWVHGHIGEIALAFVATLLVVFGGSINRTFARTVRPYPWVVRITAFVLMCAFGYGAVTVMLTPLLAEVLLFVETRYLGLVAVAAFLAIGVIAERKHQI